jgi:glutamate--cysteine ligase
MDERNALRDGVPTQALHVPFRNGTLRDLAREALKISAAGLQRRAVHNSKGADESRFLDPLIEVVESGQTAAERKLVLFHGEWQGDIDRVFREFAY